jgi:hypothetical protein
MAFNHKLFNALHPTVHVPKHLTLDSAHDTFMQYPSMRSAGNYLDMLILYEQDDMIGDDTFHDGIAEIRDYLLGVPHDKS